MADQDHKSSLPIRSEADGADERVHVKLVDYSDPSGVEKQVEVSEKLVHVRVFGHDKAGDKQQVKLSESGNVALDGDYTATTNTNPSSVAQILHDRKGTGESPAREDQNVRPTGVKHDDGTKTIVAADVALHDEDGVPFSEDNPLPVSFAESEGTEVHDFFASAAAVVKDGTDTHNYVVPAGKIFLFEQVIMDSSIQHKIDVAYGAVGAEVRHFTKFGTKSKDASFTLSRAVKLAAGEKIVITRKNEDQTSGTLYSTIVGLLKNA